MKRIGVLAGVIVLTAMFPAMATATNGVACGSVVTQSITLTHDLVDCAGDGLIAGQSGITIDLGGHTIDGDEPAGSSNGGAGVRIPPGVTGVTVLKGTITQFSEGVVVDSTSGASVSKLNITDTTRGINLANASGNRIEKNTVSRAFLDGIRVDGAGSNSNVVTQNVVRGSNFIGITVSNSADDNTIDRNVIDGGIFGIAVFSWPENTVLTKNEVSNMSGVGIQVDAFSDDANVARNNVHDNSVGIFIKDSANNATVERNVVWENAGDGVQVGGDDAVVSRNEITDNGGWGINVMATASNTTLAYNYLSGNAQGGTLDNGSGTTTTS